MLTTGTPSTVDMGGIETITVQARKDTTAVSVKPVVAIIGRQNVGKSTLLNKIAGKRIAIVEDLPGTTRDRIFADVSWRGVTFTLVDTGGLEPTPQSRLAQEVRKQAELAIADADLIIFLTDVTAGVMPDDVEIANILRQTKKPVLLVVNKVDNASLETQASEFYQLGVGEPYGVSAYHGRGVAELLDKVVSLLPAPPTEDNPKAIGVAIVGRQGVGKSTLLNAILGEERAIVYDTPGTTRDAIDTPLDFRGESVLLIDTAGIRRRGKPETDVERYSVLRALRAIDRADVALLVLDGSELPTAQDMHIAGYVRQLAKGIVLVVNKWDLAVTSPTEYTRYIRDRFKFMPYAPVMYASAIQGQEVDQIMPQVYEVYQSRFKRVGQAELASVVQQAVASHPLPRGGGKQLRILSAAQSDVNPPTFAFTVNDAKLIHFSFERYLENTFRRVFGFTGNPIRLLFKTRGG